VGPERVEIAGAALRIEHWTGFVVAEGVKGRRRLWSEASRIGLDPETPGDGIAGECRGQPIPGGRRALADAIRTIRIGLREALEALLQPLSVCGSNRKDAIAALRASRMAEQVRTAVINCARKGAIHQGDEVPILPRKGLFSLPGAWAGVVT
jgi:hypothetical protein